MWPDAIAEHLATVPRLAGPETLVTQQQQRVQWGVDRVEVRHLVHGTRLVLERGASMSRATVQLSREGRRHALPWLRRMLGRPPVDWWLHVEVRAPGDRHPLRLSAPVTDPARVAGVPELHRRRGQRAETHLVEPATLWSLLVALHRVGVPVRTGGAVVSSTTDAAGIAGALDTRLQAELDSLTPAATDAAADDVEETVEGVVSMSRWPPRPLLAGLVASLAVPCLALVLDIGARGSWLWAVLAPLVLFGLVANERRRLEALPPTQAHHHRPWEDISGPSVVLWTAGAVGGLMLVEPWNWPLPEATAAAAPVVGGTWVGFTVGHFVLYSVSMGLLEAAGRHEAPEMIGPTMPVGERVVITGIVAALGAIAVNFLLGPFLMTLGMLGAAPLAIPIVIVWALIGRGQARAWTMGRSRSA